MPRTASSCGPVVPNYLRPTASSMAQRHPRAAKSFDGDSQVTYRTREWKENNTSIKSNRRSTSISCSCMRNKSRSQGRTNSEEKSLFKTKKKTKELEDCLSSETDLRHGLKNRFQPKNISSKPRIQASLASVRSFVDSAKDFIPERQHKPFVGVSPEPTIKERELDGITRDSACGMFSERSIEETSKPDHTAAVVLTILFRMNKPRPVVKDLFDIVVAANNKYQKRKKQKSSFVRSRIAGMQNIFDRLADIGYGSLLKILQRQAVLVAFPLIVLKLVSQFPSLLTTILMLTRGQWHRAFLPNDVYLADGLLGCLSPIHALLTSL